MDAKGLNFADGEFDTVFSNTILHHIPDPRPFLREARRVLRPGGTLLVRDLFRPPSREQLEALVAAPAGYDEEDYTNLTEQQKRILLRPGVHARPDLEGGQPP